VLALLADPAHSAALGKEARQLIEQRFSWRRVIDDLDGIYTKLVQAKRC
jgi:glycosyltransferase involved in cell wall biosynthesis